VFLCFFFFFCFFGGWLFSGRDTKLFIANLEALQLPLFRSFIPASLLALVHIFSTLRTRPPHPLIVQF